MAVVLATSGSQTAVIGTEHSLYSTAVASVYVASIDTTNLAMGDTIEIRVYGKARSTDTKAIVYYAVFSNVQTDNLKISIALPTPHYWEVSIKQTVGTGRSFPWAVYSM